MLPFETPSFRVRKEPPKTHYFREIGVARISILALFDVQASPLHVVFFFPLFLTVFSGPAPPYR